MRIDTPEFEVIRTLCSSFGTPKAVGINLLLSTRDYRALSEISIDSRYYSCADAFRKDYLLVSLLSKWKGWDTYLGKIDRKASALQKWKSSEMLCLETNHRFRNGLISSQTLDILKRAREIIYTIIGDDPPVHRIMSCCKWGPGSTNSVKKREGLVKKLSEITTVTSQAKIWLDLLRLHDRHWFHAMNGVFPDGDFCWLDSCSRITDYNVMEFVPKNFKIDRPIAKEPTANAILQQGPHTVLRSKMKSYGINLDDQTINQELARRAFSERLATIDLSSASDTVSYELVRFLFPERWFNLLDDLRSPATLHNGEVIALEKFSSMGNATTFEIETLIFFSVCQAVEQEYTNFRVSVYGDDIIVTQTAFSHVLKVLSDIGFVPNMDKSFGSGNFYESCGKHYFSGVDVTPVYQKERTVEPIELIRFHNRLYRWDAFLTRKARKYLRTLWPMARVPMVPAFSQRDDGFWTDKRAFETDKNHGYKCLVYSDSPKLKTFGARSLLAYKLRRPEWTSPDQRGYPASEVGRRRYKLRETFVPFHALNDMDPLA